jgi:TPP-dependent pyruvate/acetoin dehydrogenase alpha subunit
MNYSSKSQLISFEKDIEKHWEDGDLPFLIHLSSGNENFLIDFFDKNIKEGDWIFSSHRSHYHALLSGISESKLKKTILDGNSMFVFDKERNFFTSSVLAGTACIAAGVAWALKKEGKNKVWCFLGDGAEEEGHFYEAVMMTEGHNLPCTFIIEDNNRSVDSSIQERMPTDFRLSWPKCVIRYKYNSSFPHAGNGCKKIITFKELKGK